MRIIAAVLTAILSVSIGTLSMTGFFVDTISISGSVSPSPADCVFFTRIFDEALRGLIAPLNSTDRNCGNQNLTGSTVITVTDVLLDEFLNATTALNLPPNQERAFSASWVADGSIGLYLAVVKTDFLNGTVTDTLPFRLVTGGIVSIGAASLNRTIINVSDFLDTINSGALFTHLISPSGNIGESSLDYCRDGMTRTGTTVSCNPPPVSLLDGNVYNMSISRSSVINVTFVNISETPAAPATGGGVAGDGGDGGGGRIITRIRILLIDALLPQKTVTSYRGSIVSVPVAVENIGDANISEISIIPLIPEGWTAFDARIDSLAVGETAARTLGIRPSLTADPGITFIPIIFIADNRVILRGSLVLDVEEERVGGLEIIPSPGMYRVGVNAQGQLTFLLRNVGQTPLTAVIARIENYDNCLFVPDGDTQIIELVDVGDSRLLSWNVIGTGSILTPRFTAVPQICSVLVTVTAIEGVRAEAETQVQLFSTLPGPDVLPSLLSLGFAVVVGYLLINRRKKHPHHKTRRRR